jgi:hypothetical protein
MDLEAQVQGLEVWQQNSPILIPQQISQNGAMFSTQKNIF